MCTRKSPRMCWKSDNTASAFLLNKDVSLMHDVLIISQITHDNVFQMLDKLYILKFNIVHIELWATYTFLLRESNAFTFRRVKLNIIGMQTHCNSLIYFVGRLLSKAFVASNTVPYTLLPFCK